jgi:hypothetical protein
LFILQSGCIFAVNFEVSTMAVMPGINYYLFFS